MLGKLRRTKLIKQEQIWLDDDGELQRWIGDTLLWEDETDDFFAAWLKTTTIADFVEAHKDRLYDCQCQISWRRRRTDYGFQMHLCIIRIIRAWENESEMSITSNTVWLGTPTLETQTWCSQTNLHSPNTYWNHWHNDVHLLCWKMLSKFQQLWLKWN
jgi:hypothetical protein